MTAHVADAWRAGTGRVDRVAAVPGTVTADRSSAVPVRAGTVRSWPLLVLAAPAAAEVFSGWVGIAQKTGFGLVSPLPGIWPSLHLDTTITLPVGVTEAYAAYALRAWLARDQAVSGRTRRFAKWSAIGSFALGMAGQIAYHLLAQAGAARAPWPITTVVSCLPVLVLAMGTALAHMLSADAGAATETPPGGRAGPATPPPPCPLRRGPGSTGPGPVRRPGDSALVRSATQDQAGPGAGPRRRPDQHAASRRDRPSPPGRQQACRFGQSGIPARPAQRGHKGFQPSPERPGTPAQRRAIR